MKYLIRCWLTIEGFVFFVIFFRDLEAMLNYSKVAGDPTAQEWIWLVLSSIVPMIACGLAAYYSFRSEWGNRFFLAGAMAVYSVFLLFSDSLAAKLTMQFNMVPAYVLLPLVGIYIACVLVPKIPQRQWLAMGALGALGVGMIIAFSIPYGISCVLGWTPTYVLPLIPLILQGLKLPVKPEPKPVQPQTVRKAAGKKKR